jgi:peptidyl-tRNA hydrolase
MTAPWAMQVVVRVEKQSPPAHTAVLRATGSAVAVSLAGFTDPAADPEVRARTERWRSGPIRKVVRRARGAGWTRQLAVPGVAVQGFHDVEVAVHVPGPVDEVDPEISRLQVGGLTLEDPEYLPRPEKVQVMFWLNPHVVLTTGKAAAQVGHAAQLYWQSLSPDDAAAWVEQEAPLDVAVAEESAWKSLVADSPVVVTDGGFTEVAPGTITVVADPVSGSRRRAR